MNDVLDWVLYARDEVHNVTTVYVNQYLKAQRVLDPGRLPTAIQPIGIVLFLRLGSKIPVCFKGYRPRALHRVQPDMPLPCSLSADILQSSRLHRF